jgi:HAMP domain-containing protein
MDWLPTLIVMLLGALLWVSWRSRKRRKPRRKPARRSAAKKPPARLPVARQPLTEAEWMALAEAVNFRTAVSDDVSRATLDRAMGKIARQLRSNAHTRAS